MIHNVMYLSAVKSVPNLELGRNITKTITKNDRLIIMINVKLGDNSSRFKKTMEHGGPESIAKNEDDLYDDLSIS